MQDKLEYLENNDATFVFRRRLQALYFFTKNVVAGVYMTLVLPSTWRYVQSIKASDWLYGLVLSVTPLATMVVSPLVGYTYDRTKRGKEVISILNLTGFAGSLIYSLPFSIWLPLLGRIFNGIGIAYEPILQGEIAWTTKPNNRLKYFALVILGFHLGLCVGPLLSTAFSRVHFSLGNWQIDYTNLPGIIMALVWLFLELFNQCMFRNVAKLYMEDKYSEAEDEALDTEEAVSSSDLSDIDNREASKQLFSQNATEDKLQSESVYTLADVFKEVCRYEIFCIFYSTLIAWTALFQGESLIPMITQDVFGWSVTQTSLAYVAIGTLLLSVYVFMAFVGSKLSEINYLLVMSALGCLSPILFLIYAKLSTGLVTRVVLFCSFVVVASILEPICNAASKSLMTKVIPVGMQGFIASIVSIIEDSGHLLAPYTGVLMKHYAVVWCSINMVMFMVGLLWTFYSTSKLKERIRRYRYMYSKMM